MTDATPPPYEWDKRPGNTTSIGEAARRVFERIERHLPDGTIIIEGPETSFGKDFTPIARALPGYAALDIVLSDALDQAQAGKGKERHANGRAFTRQPIMEIGRMCGLGYPTGQAQKKTQEAVSMTARGEHDRAVAELLGAINYLAAAILLIRETEKD